MSSRRGVVGGEATMPVPEAARLRGPGPAGPELLTRMRLVLRGFPGLAAGAGASGWGTRESTNRQRSRMDESSWSKAVGTSGRTRRPWCVGSAPASGGGGWSPTNWRFLARRNERTNDTSFQAERRAGSASGSAAWKEGHTPGGAAGGRADASGG